MAESEVTPKTQNNAQNNFFNNVLQQQDNGDITINLETVTAVNLTNYVKIKHKEYVKRDWTDFKLWEAFTEDFNGFTREIFAKVGKNPLKDFGAELRSRGVWVKRSDSERMPISITKAAEQESCSEWTAQLIDEYIDSGGKFKSKAILFKLNGRNLLPVNTRLSLKKETPLDQPGENHIIITNNRTKTDNTSPGPSSPTPLELEQQEEGDIQSKRDLPTGKRSYSSEFPKPPAFTRELANLIKSYPEESKYNGENDNFNFKLTIFNNIYKKVDVPQETRAQAFGTILKGQALNYFYTKTTNKQLLFEDMYTI